MIILCEQGTFSHTVFPKYDWTRVLRPFDLFLWEHIPGEKLLQNNTKKGTDFPLGGMSDVISHTLSHLPDKGTKSQHPMMIFALFCFWLFPLSKNSPLKGNAEITQ